MSCVITTYPTAHQWRNTSAPSSTGALREKRWRNVRAISLSPMAHRRRMTAPALIVLIDCLRANKRLRLLCRYMDNSGNILRSQNWRLENEPDRNAQVDLRLVQRSVSSAQDRRQPPALLRPFTSWGLPHRRETVRRRPGGRWQVIGRGSEGLWDGVHAARDALRQECGTSHPGETQ
jgi:hypothetical protein